MVSLEYGRIGLFLVSFPCSCMTLALDGCRDASLLGRGGGIPKGQCREGERRCSDYLIGYCIGWRNDALKAGYLGYDVEVRHLHMPSDRADPHHINVFDFEI